MNEIIFWNKKYFLLSQGITTMIILLLSLVTVNEDEKNFFVFFTIFFTLTSVVFLKDLSKGKKLLLSLASGSYWVIFYTLFVNYQDHPWFSNQSPMSCDGPCFGWYTFENSPIYSVLIAEVLISLMISLIYLKFIDPYILKNKKPFLSNLLRYAFVIMFSIILPRISLLTVRYFYYLFF